jgi:hypothetical protein
VGLDEFKSVKMATFIVKGEYKQLEAFCDKHLNDPTDGEIRYKPLFSHFLMTIADLAGYALNEEGHRIGWLSEKDLVFWIPTVALKRVKGNLYRPSHLAWFSPYIFIDNPFALKAVALHLRNLSSTPPTPATPSASTPTRFTQAARPSISPSRLI